MIIDISKASNAWWIGKPGFWEMKMELLKMEELASWNLNREIGTRG